MTEESTDVNMTEESTDVNLAKPEVSIDVVDPLIILKRKQTTSLSAVTRTRNQISSLLVSDDNLHLVKSGLLTYDDLFLQYQKAHGIFYDALESDDDRDKELKRYHVHETIIHEFRNQLTNWIPTVEQRLSDQLEKSSSTTSKSSRRSKASSTRSAHAREKAKIAALLVEQEQQDAQLELQRKQQALEAEQQKLMLNIELGKARARERVYAEHELIEQEQSESISHIPVSNILETATSPYSRTEPNQSQFNAPPPVEPIVHIMQSDKSRLNPLVSDFKPGRHSHRRNCTLPDIQSEHQTTLLEQQRRQNEQLLAAHQQLATAISLPQPEVPKFTGKAIDYNAFIMAFDTRIVSRTVNDADRLYYLDQHLDGDPKDLIGGCMYMTPTEGYHEARTLLDKEYGDPYKVSVAYIDKILSWSQIKSDDSHALKRFSIFLIRCMNAMQTIVHLNVLNHLPNLQAIIQKLPSYIQNKWRDHVNKIRRTEQRTACFADLVCFINSASDSANDPVFSREALHKASQSSTSATNRYPSTGMIKPSMRTSNFAVNVDSTPRASSTVPPASPSRKCYYCHAPHDLDDCQEFLKLSIDQRRNFLRDKHMCFACYGFNHTSKGCLRKRTCRKCSKSHPTALHLDNFQPNYQNNRSQHESGSATHSRADISHTESTQTCYVTDINNTVVLHAIIPVRVSKQGCDQSITTYAFYDNGSSGCFLTEALRRQLGAEGTQTTLQLRTMHGQSTTNAIAVTGLVVSSVNGENPIELPKSFTRDDIPVHHSQIPKPHVLSQWLHLEPATDNMPAYMPDLPIGLLIGSNCPKALQPLTVIPSNGDGPFATLYPHGWTINGPLQITAHGPDHMSSHRISIRELESFKETFSPSSILKLFELDFNELYTDQVPGALGPSQEDTIFLQKAEDTIQYVDGHYMLPLPFRDNNIIMPNNREQAVKRAACQKKKMSRNHQYYTDYVSFIDTLLDKGYASMIPTNHLQTKSGKMWYLPHHAIYHPTKPDKIRVVFDCSASYGGTSLNSQLLQGPDLTNSLIGVLTRFREEHIAFMGDVEAMFHQVKTTPEHHDFLRFLWWPHGDLSQNLQEYAMTVHLFGATSSPSIANFALKKTANESLTKFAPEVATTIQRNFYVDDCLKSVPDEQTAVKMIKDLQAACQKGGFNLTKFCCTSHVVMNAVPEQHRAKCITSRSLDCEDYPTERALGVQWCLSSDTFKFTIKLTDKPSTRRGILSMVCSVYDPLGFVSPFLLCAKKILQDLCREQNLDWDDPVPDEYIVRWDKWLSDLQLLEHITVDRCTCVSSHSILELSILVSCTSSQMPVVSAMVCLRTYDCATQLVGFTVPSSWERPA